MHVCVRQTLSLTRTYDITSCHEFIMNVTVVSLVLLTIISLLLLLLLIIIIIITIAIIRILLLSLLLSLLSLLLLSLLCIRLADNHRVVLGVDAEGVKEGVVPDLGRAP